MKYDDVLSLLGDFGKYQRLVYTAICIPLMFEGMQLMSPVFILAVPKYRCAIPGLPNDTYTIQDSAHKDLINTYIPTNDVGEYSKCHVYHYTTNVTHNLMVEDRQSQRSMECEKWVYDQTDFLDTVITETNLVCKRTIYRAHATMAMNVGALLGFVSIGTLADKFGRKKATLGELVVMGLFSCLSLWLPNIYVFIAIRLLIGLGFGVFYNSCYIYAMEIVGQSKRTLCGMLQNFFWAAGILIQSVLAYYIRSWRALQLAISLPVFGVLTYWWYLPNSGRWLMSMGRTQECQKIFQRMAEVNNKTLNVDLLPLQPEESSEIKPQSFWKIFKSRSLTIRTLIVFWNWYTVSLLYFGLSFNVANLSGNIYSNFAISGVMEVVGYALCFPGLYFLKRKKFHCCCMILGGIVVLASILPQIYGNAATQWSVVLLAMIGKLVSSSAFATIYLFSAELFPTVVRSRTMGVSAAFSTLGGMTAPYIVELWVVCDDASEGIKNTAYYSCISDKPPCPTVGDALQHNVKVNLLEGDIAALMPFIIFGVTSLSAGIVSIVLPETQDKQLPDTIEEMKQLGKTGTRS